MGKITDKTAVHFRMLNASKGPAVHSSRMQCDKQLYRLTMKAVVENQQNLNIRQAMVESLVIENGTIKGVLDQSGYFYGAKKVIITTGTFLNGLVHIALLKHLRDAPENWLPSDLPTISKGLVLI